MWPFGEAAGQMPEPAGPILDPGGRCFGSCLVGRWRLWPFPAPEDCAPRLVCLGRPGSTQRRPSGPGPVASWSCRGLALGDGDYRGKTWHWVAPDLNA